MVTLKYVSCVSCADAILEGDIFVVQGDDICESCVGEYTRICHDCNEIVYKDDCKYVHSEGTIVCDDCIENYNECWNCEYVGTDTSVSESQCCDEYVCETCESDWYLSCCDIWACGDYCFDRHIDFCENASNDMMNEFSHMIHEYMHKPKPIFHFTSKETFDRLGEPMKDNNLNRFGIEIETQAEDGTLLETESTMHNFINNGSIEDHLYIKEDGSISGLEFVSHVASLRFHLDNFGWNKLFESLKADNHYTDVESGMHVHVSRNNIIPDNSSKEFQDDIENKFITLLDKHSKNWENVSGGINREYADMFLHGEDSKELQQCQNKSQVEEFLLYKKDDGIMRRRRAINFSTVDQPTIEFRFLRSTLEFDTFKARLQAIDTMIEFVKKFDIEEIACSEWDDIIELAIELNHEEFVDQHSK